MPWLRHVRSSVRLFSTLPIRCHVSLAYDLYEPPKAVTAAHTGSIIFMHGLFGSKRNNRSISKYDYHAGINVISCSPQGTSES